MYSVLTIDLNKENLVQIPKLCTFAIWVISGSELSSITIVYIRGGNIFHWENMHCFWKSIYMCIYPGQHASSVVCNLFAEGRVDREANNRWEGFLKSIYTPAGVPFSPEVCDNLLPWASACQCNEFLHSWNKHFWVQLRLLVDCVIIDSAAF